MTRLTRSSIRYSSIYRKYSKGDIMPEKIPEDCYTKMMIEKCEENHIWLNKLSYLNADDAQKIHLANIILEKLNCKSTQLPDRGITDDLDVIRELAELTPILYLSINWS